MTADKPSKSLTVYLDALRFGSAVLVVMGHARLHIFGQEIAGHGWVVRAFDLATSLGHAAVVVFFAVSGYLVGGKLYEAWRPDFLRKYFRDRASRIYTVALPVLVLSFALVAATNATLGQSFKLTSDSCRPELPDLFMSLAFLHRGTGVNTCFDSPIWSLICEVFYYAMFGLAAVVLIGRTIKARVICGALVVALLVYSLFDKGDIWGYAPLWLIGAAAANPRLRSMTGALLASGAVALLVLMVYLRHGTAMQEAVIALAVTSSIVAMNYVRVPPIEHPTLARICAAGAAFSYSLYLAHAPAMNWVRTVEEVVFAHHQGRPERLFFTVVDWAGMVLVGILAGWLCYWAFERHTQRVRTVLDKLLQPSAWAHLLKLPPAKMIEKVNISRAQANCLRAIAAMDFEVMDSDDFTDRWEDELSALEKLGLVSSGGGWSNGWRVTPSGRAWLNDAKCGLVHA